MPEYFRPTTVRPDDFDEYWKDVIAELDAIPISAEEEELPLRSNAFCTAYSVRFTSIGPYRLFGTVRAGIFVVTQNNRKRSGSGGTTGSRQIS